jgi:hypothetical protein
MAAACPHISPEAARLWARVREAQQRDDVVAVRAAVNELAREMQFDGLTVEPHRVPADGRPWSWLDTAEQWTRWELARQLAAALDTTVLTEAA